MQDPWRVEVNIRDGKHYVEVVGLDDWFEATCPECGQPIRWVLDLIGFTSRHEGAFRLAHARCVWTRGAFLREADQADTHPPGE